MNPTFKDNRSHSEVGDTLRYFNSVSSSKSWCGQEYFQEEETSFGRFLGLSSATKKRGGNNGGKCGRKQRCRKKSRSNSSSSQYLNSRHHPSVTLAIRNNSIAGYQFDTILDDETLYKWTGHTTSTLFNPNSSSRPPFSNTSSVGNRSSSLASSTTGIICPGYSRQISHSAPHSHKNSSEVIAIVLHPPDEEDGGAQEVDGAVGGEKAVPFASRNTLLFRGGVARRSTSLDSEDCTAATVMGHHSKRHSYSHHLHNHHLHLSQHHNNCPVLNQEQQLLLCPKSNPRSAATNVSSVLDLELSSCGHSCSHHLSQTNSRILMRRSSKSSAPLGEDQQNFQQLLEETVGDEDSCQMDQTDHEQINIKPSVQAAKNVHKRSEIVQIIANPLRTVDAIDAVDCLGSSRRSLKSDRSGSGCSFSVGFVDPISNQNITSCSSSDPHLDNEITELSEEQDQEQVVNDIEVKVESEKPVIEASETGAAVAVAIPACVFTAFKPPTETRRQRKWRRMKKRIIPKCVRFGSLEDLSSSDDEASSHDGSCSSHSGSCSSKTSTSDSRLDLADRDLENIHRQVIAVTLMMMIIIFYCVLSKFFRGIMARTNQKYLALEGTTFPDRLFTGFLIVLTMVGILVLFWYQNFGPGFKFRHVKN